ncbi:MAG: T9SS type A sorting domain-containing protein [Flavobacteriales bacterium]|nr:T9SS type A sorting domain-containing protein [Flavobacteriales bacterium]
MSERDMVVESFLQSEGQINWDYRNNSITIPNLFGHLTYNTKDLNDYSTFILKIAKILSIDEETGETVDEVLYYAKATIYGGVLILEGGDINNGTQGFSSNDFSVEYQDLDGVKYVLNNGNRTIYLSTDIDEEMDLVIYFEGDVDNYEMGGDPYYSVNSDLDVSLNIKEEIISRSQMKFEVYPNPVKDKITMDYSFLNSQNVSITLSSIDGKELKSFKTHYAKEKVNYKEQIDIGDIPNGVYFLNIKGQDNIYRKKIVKN